jgi:hypothetical protein
MSVGSSSNAENSWFRSGGDSRLSPIEGSDGAA